MSKTIYRKLKDYIQKTENSTIIIFGDLMSRDCCYCFEDENCKWHEWFGVGVYRGEMDFLLDYYVTGIHPDFRLDKDRRIIPFLYITLRKEKPNYE